MFLFSLILLTLIYLSFSSTLFEEYACVYTQNDEVKDIGCFLDDCPQIGGYELYSSLRTSIKKCFSIRDGNYNKSPYCLYRCNQTDWRSVCLEAGNVCPDYSDEGCPRFLGLLDFATKEDCDKYLQLDIDENWCLSCMETYNDLMKNRGLQGSEQYCQSGIPDELCVTAKYIVGVEEDDTDEEIQRTALELCSKGRYNDPSSSLEKCSSYSMFPRKKKQDNWPIWIPIASVSIVGINFLQFLCCLFLCTWLFDILNCFFRLWKVGKCLMSCFCMMCCCCVGFQKVSKKESESDRMEEIESILYETVNGEVEMAKKDLQDTHGIVCCEKDDVDNENQEEGIL